MSTTPQMPIIKPQTEIPEVANFLQRSVCIVITRGSLGTSKALAPEKLNVNTDKKLVSASKQILDCPELRAIWKLDNQFTNFLDQKSLPSILKRSARLIPQDY